jgi:VanZ family protein
MEPSDPVRSRRIKNWLPAVLWAALIFFFSSDTFAGENTGRLLGPLLRYFLPHLSDGAIEWIHLALRKLGHFSEYFVLAVLLARALREEPARKRAAVVPALTALYAVSDELHQMFVPSRTASLGDIAIDIVGGVCGMLWAHLRTRKSTKRGKYA